MRKVTANRMGYLAFLFAFVLSGIGSYLSGEAIGAGGLVVWSVFWLSLRWTWPNAWRWWWRGEGVDSQKTTYWIVSIIGFIVVEGALSPPLWITGIWLVVLVMLYTIWVWPDMKSGLKR